MTRKTSTSDLAAAMMVLANDIDSEDGVANAAILEAAQRLQTLDGQANVLCGLLAECCAYIEPNDSAGYLLLSQIETAMRGLT